MQLFKRLLLSCFPDSLVKDSFNPASMFVSFISAKDFFTVIDRKIIENYKLNLFDLSMDIFEGKVGLGNHKDVMQSKMTDTYYSYIAAANFNGYKFYNVGNTATAITLLSSLYLYDSFDEEEKLIFVDSIYAFFLLTFLFAGRLKVFPGKDEKSDFQRFVDLYFNFFEVVIGQLKHKITKKHFQEIRTKMLSNIEVFFMMFHYEKHISGLYFNEKRVFKQDANDFYQWLFGPQLSALHRNFLSSVNDIIYNSKFGTVEESILFEIVPADIHLKYLFLDTDIGEVISNVVANIYDRKVLDKKLTALMKNESELNFIIDYITDPENFKRGFFKGVKQYISHMRLENQDSYEELDEMMSEIGDDIDKIDQMKIPASIKKESRIMEQFLNFYVSYIGGLHISRAETFFLRFFKPGLIPELIKYFDITFKTDKAINYSGLNHFLYVKNNAYYQFVNKKVRLGKEKFFVPTNSIKADPIKVTPFLMKMEDEIALTTLLQECNPHISKLYVKNKTVLDWFQAQYAEQIYPLIHLSSKEFIYNYYEPIFSHFSLGDNILQILENVFTDQDIVRLKNSLYAFDVQLFREVLQMFPWKKFSEIYNDTIILHQLSLLRETLFGFVIYYKYLQISQDIEEGGKRKLDLSLLKRVYLLQILNRDESLYSVGSAMLDTLLEQFGSIFAIFVEFDDNKQFFPIIKENWQEFVKKLGKKSDQQKQELFSTEDLLWLRGVLKHITYYNKRYLIPA